MKGLSPARRRDIACAVLISTAACAIAVLRRGLSADLPAYLCFGTLTGPLTVIDCRARRLADALTLPAYPLILGVLGLAAAARHDIAPLLRSLLAAVAVTAFYLVLLLIRPYSLGFGDVKLSGSVALLCGWIGWRTVLVSQFVAFTAVSLAGVTCMLIRGDDGRTELPFGPFLIIGTFTAILS